ncbi:MAG TPA: hypothetical protein VHX88_02675 [Solirubrobacteraceae bacterium]|nr:hypothetical protein [Solirubrobacteraceae bacterium]
MSDSQWTVENVDFVDHADFAREYLAAARAASPQLMRLDQTAPARPVTHRRPLPLPR